MNREKKSIDQNEIRYDFESKMKSIQILCSGDKIQIIFINVEQVIVGGGVCEKQR